MSRPPSQSRNRRNEILDAAFRMFAEKGYEDTSIRGIMQEVGAKQGLFYYYFTDKADLHRTVLDRFFSQYEPGFDYIVRRGRTAPYCVTDRLVAFSVDAVRKFREEYDSVIHEAMRWSIRERVMTMAEPYCRDILVTLQEHGITPCGGTEAASVMLAHGVGSLIMQKDMDWLSAHGSELRRCAAGVFGLGVGQNGLVFPRRAAENDLTELNALMESAPPLLAPETENLLQQIRENNCFLVEEETAAVGMITVQNRSRRIEALYLRPEYRSKGVEERLINTAMSVFEPGEQVRMRAAHPSVGAELLTRSGFSHVRELPNPEGIEYIGTAT